MTVIKTKRAYEAPAESDGYRILVDRLWPRGLTHERVDCQLWEKDLAPSSSHPVVTFVYGSRDEVHNEATVLQQLCDSELQAQ